MGLGHFLFLFGLSFQSAFACTTFCLDGAQGPVMAKSFDWNQGHGVLLVNPRGLRKKALGIFPTDKPHTWTAHYGSLTFNQIAREFPLAGINEAGLAVEIMVVKSDDPLPDDRPTVNELQWIQLQLDQYATVEEVMKHLEEVRISRVQAQVHYLVCDATAACGTVEVLGKKFVSHWGETLPVRTLTNHPYSESFDYLKKFSGSHVPSSQHSLDRFVRATVLAKQYDPAAEKAEAKAFSILGTVFTDGYSQWNVVYDLKNRRIAHKTLKGPEVHRVELGDLDFSCRVETVARDVNSSGGFTPFTSKENEKLIRTATELTPLPEPAVKAILNYPSTLQCSK